MDYSIVIPVFNKASLTKQCLDSLRPTLEGAGEGEVIVIDNASSDETPEMLKAYPWARVVRNERNLGFSGANNQGARMARGEFLVLLNNDTKPHSGWLASMLRTAREENVGAVGARLLFPSGTIQHGGVVVGPVRASSAGFFPYHALYQLPANDPAAREPRDYQIVTGACLVTPRSLYLELGGLDEGFWNGYEDVDYCLKIRARGMRVVYEGRAVVTHFESQSGVQRFRRVAANVERLSERWNGKVAYDHVTHELRRGFIRREVRRMRGQQGLTTMAVPPVTVMVHGADSSQISDDFKRRLEANVTHVRHVVYVDKNRALEAAREQMIVRGDRYLVFVHASAKLEEGWLDELVRQVEFGASIGCATYAPELAVGEDVQTLAADARCTLLSLRLYPQHEVLGHFDTLDGAVADFTMRGVQMLVGARGAASAVAELPPLSSDASFIERHGVSIAQALTGEPAVIESALRRRKAERRPFVSIVMLSWNAPQFTKIALDSIRAHTSGEYEVIIVDNGSGAETTDWLRALDGVRVIFNSHNRGFAGGNNQGIAAARGEYVILLNNDVVVTEGWVDGLLAPFSKLPTVGVTAPRSNRVAGHQLTLDSEYGDLQQMHAYAANRRRLWRGDGYTTDRAIGLCLCIDRRALEQVGGIDERFGVGNFEDDDFCLRVRAAGYKIYVCDDVFIHHFGSQSFAANKVDYSATMQKNWRIFADKWDLPREYPQNGYDSAPAIARGFDPQIHFVPFAALETVAQDAVAAAAAAGDARAVFFSIVDSEDDWSETAAFAKRYLKAYATNDSTVLAIAARGELTAAALASRVAKLVERLDLREEDAPNVDLIDENDVETWVAGYPPDALRFAVNERTAGRVSNLAPLPDQSPSALRRLLVHERAG